MFVNAFDPSDGAPSEHAHTESPSASSGCERLVGPLVKSHWHQLFFAETCVAQATNGALNFWAKSVLVIAMP